jgi:hypothetical protein
LPFIVRCAVLAGMLLLAGCIYSKRDLADELTPEFPLADGAYLDGRGEELDVERVGQLYRVTNPDREIYEIAFFRIPGYDGYAVRLNPDRVGTAAHLDPEMFAYGLARRSGATMQFYLVATDAALPPELASLVERKETDDSGFGVRDEKDTLRVLQLVAKGVELKELMTLTPKP